MAEEVVAVDIGGTQMRAALVDADGRLLRRCAQPTDHAIACPEAVHGLVARLQRHHRTWRAVVGVPGRVDYGGGRLEHAPNLPPGWIPELARRRLSEVLDLQVALANDADLAAVGETWFGAGRDYDDVLYLTVSTGVGAGVVLGGRLVAGHRSSAEIGHTVIDRRWRTVEELGSGTALEEAAAEVGLDPDGARILQLVEAGDEAAARVWAGVVEAVSMAVVNLAWIYSPQIIVVGGGVGLNADPLFPPLRRALDRHGPPGLPRPIDVVRAGLGDDAALRGAAAWSDAVRR